MKFLEQLERYKKLDELIKKEKSGTPRELAAELFVSRGHLYRLISDLKDLGAEIKFSRKKNTFLYLNPFDFHKNLTDFR